jgi:hypothetical protein
MNIQLQFNLIIKNIDFHFIIFTIIDLKNVKIFFKNKSKKKYIEKC